MMLFFLLWMLCMIFSIVFFSESWMSSVPFSVVLVLTCIAYSLSSIISFFWQRMPFMTIDEFSVYGREGIPPKNILFVCNEAKMKRITTGSIIAKMIEYGNVPTQSPRNWFYEPGVCQAMNLYALARNYFRPRYSDSAITRSILRPRPLPTLTQRIIGIYGDLTKNAFNLPAVQANG